MEATQHAQGAVEAGFATEAQRGHLVVVGERPGPDVATGVDMESRLLQLAAAARPLRRALAALAARLVATRAYERLCYARLGDYARERAGLSARQLRDLAHGHAALVAMPRLEQALLAGELPWSKVRLVARVASEGDVDAWIALARALPIRRLEREVSSLAEAADGADGLAAQGAAGPGSARGTSVDGWEDPDAGVPLTRVTVHCTPAVREKWALARALLRIERAGDVCPELRHAFRQGRLSWAKALSLVPFLLLDFPGPWRPRWVAWAERVTVRRLEADVERALLLRAASEAAWQRCKFHPEQAQEPLPEAERQKCAAEIDVDATERLSWRVPVDVAGLFLAARAALREALRAAGRPAASDGTVFEALLDAAIATWTRRDPAARRPDPVIERDGYRCTVPGCSSRRSLHDHHITFRSASGSDAPENRITLCAFHHQRCLHQRRMRISGEAPGHLVFELGLRTGAAPLARYASGDVAL